MLVEEEDDDSSVASSPFDDGGFLDSLDSVGGAAGDGLESSSAAVSAVVEGHPFSPRAPAAATATTEATTAPDEPPDLSGAGPSMSSGEQHGYQLRRRIPQPPNAFMLFAMENRRSVAAENPNEDNRRVSTRLGKFWRSLSAAAKESYRRKAAVAAAIHRIKYPGII
ncbi:sex-determining region Y protein-like [Rhipicephalus microplus]|uniref:sex-determining region Y protein-like n=1 Tax=Rhipicephalus microplus TaxID=6941 RepID=UPI003F6BA69D